MKNTKNQHRMERLSTASAIIRKVHEDVRYHTPTQQELVGLTAELNDLLMAAGALHAGVCVSRNRIMKTIESRFLQQLRHDLALLVKTLATLDSFALPISKELRHRIRDYQTNYRTMIEVQEKQERT